MKRLSVTLNDDAAAELEYLAQVQGITQTEALRRAIATESFLLRERKQGSVILLQKHSKDIREVFFR